MDSKTLLERLDAMAATRHGGDINELLADLRPLLERLAAEEADTQAEEDRFVGAELRKTATSGSLRRVMGAYGWWTNLRARFTNSGADEGNLPAEPDPARNTTPVTLQKPPNAEVEEPCGDDHACQTCAHQDKGAQECPCIGCKHGVVGSVTITQDNWQPMPTLPTLAEWEEDAAVNALRFCEAHGWIFHNGLHIDANRWIGFDRGGMFCKDGTWAAAVRAACEATGTALPWREPEPEWQPPESIAECLEYLYQHTDSVRLHTFSRDNAGNRVTVYKYRNWNRKAFSEKEFGSMELAIREACRWVHEQEAKRDDKPAGCH